MICEKHGHHAGICWPCADEAGRTERRLLRDAALVLDAIARCPIVICLCGEGHRTCDCGGDAVRQVLADLRSYGIDPPNLVPVQIPPVLR